MNRIQFGLKLGGALIGGGVVLNVLLISLSTNMPVTLFTLLGVIAGLELVAGVGLFLISFHRWQAEKPLAEVRFLESSEARADASPEA